MDVNQQRHTGPTHGRRGHLPALVIHEIVTRFERLISRTSPDGNATFFDKANFPWIPRLETNWQLIRRELDAILSAPENIPAFEEISEDQESLTSDKRWKTFFLYGYGHRVGGNCALCPSTDRLLQQIPGMKTAFFSILEPGKHLPSHRGVYKGVLRYHLGLLVPTPEEACGIRVGQDQRSWKEGESLVFDDTHEHEAWNRSTSERRVVLFVDFLRPLPLFVSLANRFLVALIAYTPMVLGAKRNLLTWEAKLEHIRAIGSSVERHTSSAPTLPGPG